ncbi:MAG: flagellar motor switch protein FliG [Burkholderiaceae bacterium]|uniref:flagellar motor switch protein FliG n=1 Tax=Castellaniella sp. TaxID=1955812 RepID=UPI00355ECD8E
MPKPTDNEDSLARCAILMMSVGEDAAAEVFKYMGAAEVQQISAAMARLQQVSRAEVDHVLERFREEVEQLTAVTLGSGDYIRSVLVKALGQDRAAAILDDILDNAQGSSSGIDALNWLEPSNVAELIGNEHPQIIATILVHLERDRAAAVLTLLNARIRQDVMLRIATFGGVQPVALQELTAVLNGVLAGQGAKRARMGGVRTAAEILNFLNSSEEESLVTALREADGDLTQRIIDEMFTFENLIDVEDASVRRILEETDSQLLAVSLKNASPELRQKFFRNMSSRAAEMLEDEIETMGPVRVSQVETEQKAILLAARKLADAGQISLSTREDDYV